MHGPLWQGQASWLRDSARKDHVGRRRGFGFDSAAGREPGELFGQGSDRTGRAFHKAKSGSCGERGQTRGSSAGWSSDQVTALSQARHGGGGGHTSGVFAREQPSFAGGREVGESRVTQGLPSAAHPVALTTSWGSLQSTLKTMLRACVRLL